MDLKREADIEQLRPIAVAQQTQIEQLLRLLASQAAELGALKGNEADLQQKPALIEELTRQSAELARDAQDAPGTRPPSEPKARKPRVLHVYAEVRRTERDATFVSAVVETFKARLA